MKIPGRLWLQFEVVRRHDRTQVRQTTVFDARGFMGLAYWYALYPLHRRIRFAGMLDGIERAMGTTDGPTCDERSTNESVVKTATESGRREAIA